MNEKTETGSQKQKSPGEIAMNVINQVGKKVDRSGTAGTALDFSKSDRSTGSAESSPGRDRVDLSQEAKIVGRAGIAVQQAAEVRTSRINALRALVKGQEYPVDARKVADKIVEEHLSELT